MEEKIKEVVRKMILDGDIVLTKENVNDWPYAPQVKLCLAVKEKVEVGCEGDFYTYDFKSNKSDGVSLYEE